MSYKVQAPAAFLAYNSSASTANVTGDGTVYTVVLDTELFDQGNNFSANTFTAPTTGLYAFQVYIKAEGLIAGAFVPSCAVVTTAHTYSFFSFTGTGSATPRGIGGSVLANMTAGDTATFTFTVSGVTKIVGFNGGATPILTFMSGYLVR